MLYTIGEMAKLLGVAPSTLRYYDKEGLLPFVERSESGIRVFCDEDYEWLKTIECMKKTGMPVKDIKTYILMAMEGDETLKQRLDIIKKQRKSVTEQIKVLNEMAEALDFKLWYYETAIEKGTAAVPREMSDEEIPPQFVKVRKRLKNKEE
ncbi:MAG: MerR family transcriptional regulator [Clostridia bacterium]